MSHLDPTRHISTSELRKFGLVVGTAFVGLAAIAFVRHKPGVMMGVLAAAGGALVLFGVAAPSALRPVHRAWVRLSLALSSVTTPLFMGALYFLVLTPLSLAMRAFGRRPLGAAKTADTAWVARPAGARSSDLERQF